MYEKGSQVKVLVELDATGVKELQFLGRVVVDAEDFMAIHFDTVILPKMQIKSADPLPDKPLEEILGTDLTFMDAINRPKPPKVENVRFIKEDTPGKTKSK